MPLTSLRNMKKSFARERKASALSHTIKGRCSGEGKVCEVGWEFQNP